MYLRRKNLSFRRQETQILDETFVKIFTISGRFLHKKYTEFEATIISDDPYQIDTQHFLELFVHDDLIKYKRSASSSRAHSIVEHVEFGSFTGLQAPIFNINSVDADAFRSMSNLKSLDLCFNSISVLQTN